MKSFLKNDNNIVLLRIMIEIIPKGIMFEIILLETIMTSFSENNNDIISMETMIVSFFVVLHISRLELAWLSSKIFNQSRYDKTNIIFGFSLMRRFQQAQNRKNPITCFGEINNRRSKKKIYKKIIL